MRRSAIAVWTIAAVSGVSQNAWIETRGTGSICGIAPGRGDGSAAAYGDETSASTDSGHFEPPHDTPPRKEWLEAEQENRCIQVRGNAMAPILADGTCVAYSKFDEDPRQLDGKMVVVWLENQPTIRWFSHCGRYGLLRAETPETVPQQQLIDFEAASEKTRMRRVLWIDTAH